MTLNIKQVITKIKNWIMAKYATLKAAIEAVVTTNGNYEISGEDMRETLKAIVDSLGANYQLVGFALPATDPGTPDQNVAYLAGPGTYPNFGPTTIEKGQIGLFKYNGTWSYETLDCGVYIEYEEYPGGDAFEWTFYDSDNPDGLTIKIAKTVSGLSNNPNVAISQWWAAQTERRINVLGGYTISIDSLTTTPQSLGLFKAIQSGQIIDSITGANKLIFGTDGGDSVTVNASDLPYKATANLINVRTDSGTANNVSIVVRGINDILPAYININEIANHPGAYANAATALGDVPTLYRRVGVKVTYLDDDTQLWIEMLCVDNNGLSNWWTDIENDWIIEGPLETKVVTPTGGQQLRIAGEKRGNLDDVLNVNVWNEQIYAYDYAALARAAVPANKRKLGAIITYLLSDGWHTEQFIGSSTSGWGTESNWKVFGPVSDIFKGKTISIVGDSIATYDGYSDNAFYPVGDVNSVTKTWWYHFIQNVNANLGQNKAYSGSRVTDGATEPNLIEQITALNNADIIILEGGQNDSSSGVDIGTLDFSKQTSDLDDTKFADAYLHYVRIALTKATNVICIITDFIKIPYAEIMKSVCSYYHLPCIDMRGKIIGKYTTSHPNYQGMMMMATVMLTSISNEIDRLKTDVYSPLNGFYFANNLSYSRGYYFNNGYIATCDETRGTITTFIAVKPNTRLIWELNPLYDVALNFYSQAKENSFISGTNWQGTNNTLTVPQNANFVRLQFGLLADKSGNVSDSIEDIFVSLKNDWFSETAFKKSLEDYASKQFALTKPTTKQLDFGEIGNYYSPTGAYTLVASDYYISTMVPFFVGKGNIVKIHLPDGLTGYYNTYPNTNPGVARTTYGTVTGDSEIVMSDDFLFITFAYASGSISPNVITDVDSKVYAIIEPINVDGYFDTEDYGNYESLDVSKIKLSRGSINNNDGSIFYHASRLFSEFIPVKPLSRLFVNTPTQEDETRLNCSVSFYNVKKDGTFSWLSQYTFDNNHSVARAYTDAVITRFDVVIPPTCNAIRVFFTKPNNVVVNPSDVNSTYLEIKCHTRSSFKNVGNPYNIITDCVNFNDINAEWLQGVGDFNIGYASKVRLCNMFKTYPGQRLAIRHNNGNYAFRINIYMWENAETTSAPTQTITNRSYTSGYGVFVVPNGINYITFGEQNNENPARNITPEMALADNWHIFDVTGKSLNLQHAEMILDITRASSYAQGMAIQKGYVFQAFADGYVDIYNLKTREFIQSLQLPYGYTLHCNNIQFGDKYDANDEFGVLWVSTDYDDSKIAGFRVQLNDGVFSFTLVYQVTPPVISVIHKEGTTQYFDFINKIMVQSCFKADANAIEPNSNGYSDLYLAVYSWTGDLNNDTVFTFIHSFEFPILWAVQGGRLYDGILYLLSGSGMNAINVFNVLEKKAIGAIDITRACFGHITEELQGIDFEDEPYISFTNSSTHHWGLVKLNL